MDSYWLLLAGTAAVETVVLVMYQYWFLHCNKTRLILALFALNLVSHPIAFTAFVAMGGSSFSLWMIESGVVAFESIGISVLMNKSILVGFKVSLLVNIFSAIFGCLL